MTCDALGVCADDTTGLILPSCIFFHYMQDQQSGLGLFATQAIKQHIKHR